MAEKLGIDIKKAENLKIELLGRMKSDRSLSQASLGLQLEKSTG
jgi:hypothetical protein